MDSDWQDYLAMKIAMSLYLVLGGRICGLAYKLAKIVAMVQSSVQNVKTILYILYSDMLFTLGRRGF